MANNADIPPDVRESAHALALHARGLTQQAVDRLGHCGPGHLTAEDRKGIVGVITQSIDLLSRCRHTLGGEPDTVRASLPPRPVPSHVPRLEQHGSTSGNSGEFSKLLVDEEVEAELEPGTRLEDVLAGVLKQLNAPQAQQVPGFPGIPGLPPASGSQQKSILASLPALSGQLKGLTPRRAERIEKEIVGKLLEASGQNSTDLVKADYNGGSQLVAKRPLEGDDDGSDPFGKKAKKGLVQEEPAGCFLPEDGWEWRKYGRKQMHGQPFPRSYFKCARAGRDECKAKKQAERCSDDPTKWRVRYIGQHNHERPPPRPVTITIVQDTAGGAGAGAGTGTGAGIGGLPAARALPPPGGVLSLPSAPERTKESMLSGSAGSGFSFGSPTPFPPPPPPPSSKVEAQSGIGDHLELGLPGREENEAPFELNDRVIDDLPSINELSVVGVIMPALKEDEDGAADRSPAETELEEPNTPLGGEPDEVSRDGGDKFSFDVVPGVSALELCFPPALAEPLPALPETSGTPTAGKPSPFPPDNDPNDMSIVVPPRRPPTLPAHAPANSPRIVITPRSNATPSQFPGLTPGLNSDNARTLLATFLNSPLATGRLNSTRVIFELGRMAQGGNSAWSPFQNQGAFNPFEKR